MYHPESNCLFEDYTDLMISMEVEDVTGYKEWEDKWMDEQRKKWQEANRSNSHFDFSKQLLTKLLDKEVIRSCWNCGNFDPSVDKCNKWKMTPPPKVIVFSCGKDGWIQDIPF